jgi:hypothetical protein
MRLPGEKKRRVPGVAENGMTSEQLARSCHRLYASLLGMEQSWENADHEAWDRAVTRAISAVDAYIEHESTIQFVQMAQALVEWYFNTNGRWQELQPLDRKVWEIVSRHIVNCVDSERGSVDVEEMEDAMLQWAGPKLHEFKRITV